MAALSPTISPAGHNEFKYKLTKLSFYMSSSCVFFYVSFYMSFYVSFYVSSCVSSKHSSAQYSHKQYITKFTVYSYIIY